MNGIEILSTGSYLPESAVLNEQFTSLVDTSDEWITSRTGIKERRFSNGEPTWYMGAQAARRALEAAGVEPCGLDMVLVSTVTPDYFSPSVSCMIQRDLGASNAFCMDVNVACSGFVYALDMARRYLACEDMGTILLVASERLSQMIDYTDRSTCVLLGDGAGACVLRRGEGMYSAVMGADGGKGGHLVARHTMRLSPFAKPELAPPYFTFPTEKFETMYMNGKEVYKFATKVLPESLKAACEKAGIVPRQLDHIIPHQANYRIVETALKSLEIDDSGKIFLNLSKYGNTASASIAIALDELNRGGTLRRGDKVGVVGFGGGLTYAAAVFEW